VIDPPRMVTALRESGLTEYRVWGWVKKSAKFIYHIGVLKGSKISTWDVIALSINEDGECNLSAPEIAKLTRYSVSETRQAIGELEEMGYLSVQRNSGKRSIYKPLYAARGANNPIEPDPSSYSTPLVGKDKRAADPSSPSIQNAPPSIKRVKRVNNDFSFTEQEQAQMKAKVYSMIGTNDPSKSWQGREMIRADLLEYADWYNRVTGQVMNKRAQADWWKALGQWKEEGLTIPDLQAAFTARSKYRTVASPNELTKDAAAIHALPTGFVIEKQSPQGRSNPQTLTRNL
jgi:hypothetical protein